MDSRINGFGTRNDPVLHPTSACVRCAAVGTIGADVTTGFYTCSSCGEVQDSAAVVSFCEGLSDTNQRSFYQRIHHLHERLSQWCGTEPPIPDDIYSLIVTEAAKGGYDRAYGEKTIKQVLRAVKVPPRLQIKYRSTKFKKLPMTTLKRFDEKWRSIQQKLTGKKMKLPEFGMLRKIRTRFLQLQPAFERVRHVKQCDGRHKCHKHYQCRHNFVHYNYSLLRLIEEVAGRAERQIWEPCFRQISTPKRRKLDALWQEMLDDLERQKSIDLRRNVKIDQIKVPREDAVKKTPLDVDRLRRLILQFKFERTPLFRKRLKELKLKRATVKKTVLGNR